MVLEEKNGVQLIEEKDENGNPVYTVLFHNESRCKTGDKGMARDNFSVLQPVKAVCSECGTMDVVVFFGRLEIGRLQVAGEGGWRMERVFGGLWDKRDITLCPECALAMDAKMNEYLARRKRK